MDARDEQKSAARRSGADQNSPGERADAGSIARAHVIAWVTFVFAFTSLLSGALVTIYQVGGAIPDWPNTFGYPWLLAPPSVWAMGPDVALVLTHRVMSLAASAALLVLLGHLIPMRDDIRRGTLIWAVMTFVVVLGVVLSGGLRLRAEGLFWANVHACLAPLVLVGIAALVTLLSPRYQALGKLAPASRRFHQVAWGTAWLLAVVVYGQSVLGAQLRHVGFDAPVGWFPFWTLLHTLTAFLVLAGGIGMMVLARVGRRAAEHGVTRAFILARISRVGRLAVVQFLVGLLTWVLRYGYPVWFRQYVWPAHFVIWQHTFWQVLVMAAHALVAMLLLADLVTLVLWLRRTRPTAPGESSPRASRP